MAFVQLEDFDGVIDVTIFPKIFDAAFKFLTVDEVVVVEGRVESSGDGVQILADRVTAVKDYVADFWLTIPAPLETSATFAALKKIFSEHEGRSRVFMNHDGTWKKFSPKISDAPDTCAALKNLLGAGNVRLY